MAETKWTPGPWHKSSLSPLYIISGDEPDPICSMGEYNEDGTIDGIFENAQANAQLIAQAPALYEALEAVLPRLAHKIECGTCLPASEWKDHGSWSYENCCCEIRQVKAVLAAARGGK